jgi:hypothetical protein
VLARASAIRKKAKCRNDTDVLTVPTFDLPTTRMPAPAVVAVFAPAARSVVPQHTHRSCSRDQRTFASIDFLCPRAMADRMVPVVDCSADVPRSSAAFDSPLERTALSKLYPRVAALRTAGVIATKPDMDEERLLLISRRSLGVLARAVGRPAPH